jgi:hypothetical protein
MLIPQCQSETNDEQGRSRSDLAELRRQLVDATATGPASRQRLMNMAQRLARVQALGDEYRRVDFSEAARQALCSVVA